MPEGRGGGAGGSGGEEGRLAADTEIDSFDSAAWQPAKREYGLFHLLLCRSAMPEQRAEEIPEQVAQLKFVDTRAVNLATAPPRRDPFSSDDDGSVSDDEHKDTTEPVAWPGKDGSWWRVHSALGEDVIVREGVSLSSAELRRIAPGDLLQQAGVGRALVNGRARGCIRVPVQPMGWVTADASKAGGPKYLVRASAPRWRVVHSTNKEGDAGDAIVREDPTLDSEAVAVLHYGDVVEQAGPSLTRSDGIVRMPVTSTVVRRGDVTENGEAPSNGGRNNSAGANGKAARILGWVTVDATAAGGPIFFKSVAEVDKDKRRRRPRQQWPGS